MDEVKNTSNDKKDGEKKGFSIHAIIQSIIVFFTDIRGEFKKIIWPSRQQLMKETVIVICISLIIGLIICGLDYVFAIGYNTLISLVQ